MKQDNLHVGLILALTIRGLAIQTFADMRRVVRSADQLNLDSVWLCDHFLTLSPDHYTTQAGVDRAKAPAASEPGAPRSKSIPLLECWTALCALSGETQRLRLGTSVLCNSYRNPAILAKMAATLDVISGGRLDLGLGAGWFQAEYEAYGVPFPSIGVRIAQLEEALEVIRRVWTDDHPTFHGAHYKIDGAICNPPPLQKPHPPIWIGGEGDKIHRVAAKLASGVNTRWWSPERFKARAQYLSEVCKGVGRDPESLRMSATLLVITSDDPRQVEEQRSKFAAIPPDGIVAGSPEQCAARLLEYREANVHHFLLTVPDVEKIEGLRLIGERILPALRSA